MKKYLFLIILAFLLTTVKSYAQVGIGTNSPNANTALDLVSTSQGVLFPRMTSAQRDVITNPAKGLTIFNISLNCIQTNVGSSAAANWKCFAGQPSTNGTAVVSGYTCATASAGTMTTGSAVSAVTQTITATVGTLGTYSITATANGVTFTGSGNFAGTGAQNIVLTATGTPTATGTNTFTLNTTPNCNFSRITNPAPLPANITLSAISPYFVASVYDQDYLPYTAPTVAASLATAQAANGTNEGSALNVQGSLTTTGVTIKIPYTVVTATVGLPAYTQTINVPASFTEDGNARDVTFSYGAATLAVGSGTINVTLQALGGTLNAKKLDLQTGIGSDNLGFLLAQFTYASNNSGGTANFDFRNIAPIPDRNIADANHVMFYVPVLGADGKNWLNNNLGANYANTTHGAFNPAAQASGSADVNAYGSLFQWGRGADGHEFRTSGTTAGPIAKPWTSTNFITNSTAPNDWRTPQDVNLWQGVSGTNNPCPIGYRLPTETELTLQRNTWSAFNSLGAIASPLKLPMPGARVSSGSFGNVSSSGYYWSSAVRDTNSRTFAFSINNAHVLTGERAFASSVRCIAAGNPSTDGTAVVSAFTCSTASAGTITAGVAVSGVNQTITATVTTVGTYIITATADGVTFAGSGTFAGTGAQNIVLSATGTPTAAGSNSFTLNTTPDCNFSRTAITVPDAPTGPVATAGIAQASVAFTAPASNGGSAITGYTVTSSPGNFTATGASSPIVVSGLTNGTAYTFTVVANNAAGNSVASTASVAVTPAVVCFANVSGISKVFMCYNLGVTGTQDPFTYQSGNNNGAIYQWGRQTDGHEIRTSLTQGGPVSAPVANRFITLSTHPYDWLNPQNNSLWLNASKTANDPCPAGFRVPTQAQWGGLFRDGITSGAPGMATRNTWTWTGNGYTVGANLYLPAAGCRTYISAPLFNVGTRGYYWSSSSTSTYAYHLTFYSDDVDPGRSEFRAHGSSVRCISE
jgi:uncharacterized protein (TIGR02145 family)